MMKLFNALIGSALMLNAGQVLAAQWSVTEVQLQRGDLTEAFGPEAGDEKSNTIITLQHASGWKYGENFFFVDHITKESSQEFYGEWYPFFSSAKIFGAEYGGAVRDVGLVLGVNAAPEVDSLKYLPGIQVNWNLPGFAFFNTLLSGYIDDSESEEDDSFMFDVAWKYPFEAAGQSFSIEGHAEYIGSRDTAFGEAESWILAQPQFRWDAGKTWFSEPGLLQLGIEYQYWDNKLGTDEKDNAVQLLVVWGL